MSTEQIVVLATMGLVVAIVSFVTGWNLSVRRWYTRQIGLADQNTRLKKAIDDLAERMESDEARAAIDLGKEAILNDLDELIAIAREDIERNRT